MTYKPGDIITAYHKGFHRVTAVKGNILEYIRIDGKRKSNSCAKDWCKKIDPNDWYEEMVADAAYLRDLMIEEMKAHEETQSR